MSESKNPIPSQSSSQAPSQNATFMRRFGAMFYDAMLTFALMMVASFIYIWANSWNESSWDSPLYTVYLLIVSLLFFGGFWVNAGQTLGMQTWGLHIEDGNGNKIRWGQASLRFFAALLSWAACGLGFLWILVDKNKLAWHDRLSNTRIVFRPETTAKVRSKQNPNL